LSRLFRLIFGFFDIINKTKINNNKEEI